jgi:hypothetical protein
MTSPSASARTSRAAVSISVTSASTTATLRWRRKIARAGQAMSPGESAAVATW